MYVLREKLGINWTPEESGRNLLDFSEEYSPLFFSSGLVPPLAPPHFRTFLKSTPTASLLFCAPTPHFFVKKIVTSGDLFFSAPPLHLIGVPMHISEKN